MSQQNRRRTADYAFLGLGICMLLTVPIAWATVAGVFLMIDWVVG